jgi:ribosomal protein S18 acetylase RimI-like enzyme
MTVILADLDLPLHQQAILRLLDMYCRDQFGSGKPLPRETNERLIAGLKEARGICFLARDNVSSEFIGLALCLPSFSSFLALPILNIHDIAVAPGHRRQGVGQTLLLAAEEEARRRGCGKVTLEVREDNEIAKGAYLRAGFQPTTPQTLFWGRDLE